MGNEKKLTKGMWNCTNIATGEKVVYHSSTAQTLLDKGIVTVGKKVKVYVPKGAFGTEQSENEK